MSAQPAITPLHEPLGRDLFAQGKGRLSLSDKFTVSFLVFFLFMGFTVELYWVVYHGHMKPHADRSFIAHLFQIYGAADSAYFDSDPAFPMGLESINVFFSQILNAWLLYAIIKGRYYRHVLQIIVSSYLAYSVTLYFLVAAIDGFSCMREKSAWNFFLFFAPNLPWLLFYLYMAYDSAAYLTRRLRGLSS